MYGMGDCLHRHWEEFIGIYLRVRTGHQIHARFTITRPHTGWWRQNIISGDRGVHYIPSYTSVNPHTFLHKAPRYIQHNGMLKYSTVHRMRCNVEQYCMVQHISHQILPDHILGDEDRILYRVTEEFITFLHTPQSTLIHSFIKPLATYSTMVC